jgi:hypothetical protein
VPGHFAQTDPVLGRLVRAGPVLVRFASAGPFFGDFAPAGSLPAHGGAAAAWPLAARASRMSIRSGSDREGVTRRIDWPGRIVRSEQTL